MKPALPGFALLAALLIVPFALRPPELVEDESADKLVVLTPHNEAIRYEITRAFRQHMLDNRQLRVRIDWRSPGGTTEISRYLGSEYRSAFEAYWQVKHGRPLSESGARGFADPKQTLEGDSEAARARREFLTSNVGIKIDVLFGGGSYEFSQHAAAGSLVDSGVIQRHPKLFGDQGIPQYLGGEPYWDKHGRWVGVCVSGYGICYNRDALSRLGIDRAPQRWTDLADPRLAGHIALADPSKAGSANKAFEMLLQQQMTEAVAQRGNPEAGSAAEAAALSAGFDAGLRLIRRIAAGARYFTDQAGKVTQDIQSGSAAAGMCIDFYGRFQAHESGSASHLGFVMPAAGSSIGSDPIGLLRGAPQPALGRELIDWSLTPAGQAIWAYRVGAPGGPKRYALRRLAILPGMYTPERAKWRSDPDDNPYLNATQFTYHAAWTGPLFRALSFVIRVSCVDAEEELRDAARALSEHGFPPRAQAAFDDMSLVSYQVVKGEIAPALASRDPLREVALQNRLVGAIKAHYERVAQLARSGE
ncbi:MAG TPA: extracellular solute-binding protein [Polyangiaceae bacterium]|nr:extracellular solute-binding protein [Polyangiaceae bacterium]